MSNPVKGEVTLLIDGVPYTLRLSVNEIVALEDKWGIGINQIAAKLSQTTDLRLGDWVVFLHHALRRHHPQMSAEDAGDLLTAAGIKTVIKALGEAMIAAFPEMAAKDGDSPSSDADQAGTGKNS